MANVYKIYKTDADKTKVYEHRLKLAEDDFRKWEKEARDAISRYENVPKEDQYTPTGHRVNVPSGTAIIDALFSSLTATDVDVLVSNMGQGSTDQADLATAALAKEWRIARVQQRANKAIKDALLCGIGWVKVGYDYQEATTTMPRLQEDIRREVTNLVNSRIESGDEVDMDEILSGVPLVNEVQYALRDRIVVDYVPWDMVRFDPTAKQVEDIRWIAQITKLPAHEVKENEIFREYAKRSRGGLRKLEELDPDSSIESRGLGIDPDDDDERITVIEFWDFETGTVCTFAKGKDWLLNETANPFSLNLDMQDKSPFVPLVLRVSPQRVRGVSDMALVLPTLDELNMYRSRLATYLERMSPKLLGPEDGLTDAGKENLRSREYGAYVEYAQTADPGAFRPLDPPAMPSEIFDVPTRLEQQIREATGVNELMRGLFPDRKRTATETAEVVSASAARQAEKRNTLEQFYIDVAKRMLQLMQMFYDAPRMLRYVTDFGDVPWQWDAEDLQFEYDLELSLTPKESETRQSRRDDALAMLNVLGPLSQPGPDGSSAVDVKTLLKWFLMNYGLDRSDVAELLNTPGQQQTQRMEQQQIAAAQTQAVQGAPNPAMNPGPMSASELAAVTNAGQIPPEMLQGATGTTPVSPGLAEQVSEQGGATPPAFPLA